MNIKFWFKPNPCNFFGEYYLCANKKSKKCKRSILCHNVTFRKTQEAMAHDRLKMLPPEDIVKLMYEGSFS